MAIRFAPVAKFSTDVPIQMLREDGGYDVGDLRVTYKVEPHSKFRELARRFGADEISAAQLLRDRVLDVEGVLDDDGQARECSGQLIDKMADDPDIGPALIDHWMRLQTRRDKEAEKN